MSDVLYCLVISAVMLAVLGLTWAIMHAMLNKAAQKSGGSHVVELPERGGDV
jgi:hypothetical protein